MLNEHNSTAAPIQNNGAQTSSDISTQDLAASIDDIDTSVLPFEPALTQEQVTKFEKIAQDYGQNRRIMFVILKNSSTELIKREPNGDLLLDMAEYLIDYKKHLEATLELLDAALARTLVIAKYSIADGEV